MSGSWNVTWEELNEVVRQSVAYMSGTAHEDLRIYLTKVPSKYKPGVALALAVAKWSPGNLKRGEGSCGLCAYYYKRDRSCYLCPLARAGHSCDDGGSLYWNAIGAAYGETGPADKLYNVLLGLYIEEYNRVCGE